MSSKLRLSTFLCGAVFGLGLAIARMTDPAKVQGFLNLFGAWDPSLAVVLAAAAGTALMGFMLIERRAPRPAFEAAFEPEPTHHVGARLVCGAALFGVGWGLTGYCPGPALVSLARLAPDAAFFIGCFVAGSALARWLSAPAQNRDGRVRET